tara:strand:- start:78 stop:206 length:129 start_codon:yes stop_codon:yes gene_type:complete
VFVFEQDDIQCGLKEVDDKKDGDKEIDDNQNKATIKTKDDCE